MERLSGLSDVLGGIATRVGRLAAWLSLALMAVILFDVVTRRFFVLGSTKLQELEWHLHGALFLLCLGYAYMRGAHVRIEVFRDKFPLRVQAWIELLGNLLFLIPYTLVLIYFGWFFVERSYAIGESSAAVTGLGERWIIKAAVPAGFALLLIAAVSISLRALLYLFGSPSMRERAEFEDIHMAQPQDPDDAAGGSDART